MKLNICVSLPIKSTSFSQIKPLITDAIKTNPNLIEFRFDFISNIKSLSFDFLSNILKIINPHIAVILTLRDPSEGGQHKVNQKERLKILKMFIVAKPDYLDVEMNTNQTLLNEVINLASQNDVKIIFSYHNLEKTISFDETVKIIKNFKEKFSLNSKIIEDYIYKIIYTAQKFEDNLVPLKLCKEMSNSNQKIISFCMGSLGILSRVNCVLAGSFLTYACLDEKTAPGQLAIKDLKEIYNILLNNH